jgi:hypothetical protein
MLGSVVTVVALINNIRSNNKSQSYGLSDITIIIIVIIIIIIIISSSSSSSRSAHK